MSGVLKRTKYLAIIAIFVLNIMLLFNSPTRGAQEPEYLYNHGTGCPSACEQYGGDKVWMECVSMGNTCAYYVTCLCSSSW